MRPGRLDRILYVGAPDTAARREIFRIKLATMALEPGVDIDRLAEIVSDPRLPPWRTFGIEHRASGIGDRASLTWADGRVFRRGNHLDLPRCSAHGDERGPRCSLCEIPVSPPLALAL